jgi:MFS transporter, DHA2 family, multidrug resistance protein
MADISSGDCVTSRAAGKGEKRSNVVSTQGNSLLQAQQQALQWIGQQVQIQASFVAHMDAFWVLMLVSISAVPLALALRKVKLGDPVHIGH